MTGPLLSVRDLRLTLPGPRSGAHTGETAPVDGVSFDIAPGECVGLVGESGSGKSLTASSIMGLTRQLPGARIGGEALWHGSDATVDLLKLGERELMRLRARHIAMVFQDPLSCLNPLLRIDYQVAEVLTQHLGLRGRELKQRVLKLLDMAGIPDPEARARQYPHQLSGGLRQRALIAIALAGEPKLLIADEPTTALDVTIQAQVLELLRRLQREQGLAILFITHDLGVVAQLCQRVMVMYAGRIVEAADAATFFNRPSHPYSQGLLLSLPGRVAADSDSGERRPLHYIAGSPPRPGQFPEGCRFNPRCPLRVERCQREYPPLLGEPGRLAACWEIEHARRRWTEQSEAELVASRGEALHTPD